MNVCEDIEQGQEARHVNKGIRRDVHNAWSGGRQHTRQVVYDSSC